MSSRITRRCLFGMAAAAAAADQASRAFGFNAQPSPLQTTVLEARVRFVPQSFLRPLIISSGKITEITEALAEVRVRVDGREALGRGSIYLSDLWAWPDPKFTHEQRDAELRKMCSASGRQSGRDVRWRGGPSVGIGAAAARERLPGEDAAGVGAGDVRQPLRCGHPRRRGDRAGPIGVRFLSRPRAASVGRSAFPGPQRLPPRSPG